MTLQTIKPIKTEEERRCSSCALSRESRRGIVLTEHGLPGWEENPSFNCDRWTPAIEPYDDQKRSEFPEVAPEDLGPIEAFTIVQVMQICRVSRIRVVRWIHAKQLPAFMHKHTWMVKPEDLDIFRRRGLDKIRWRCGRKTQEDILTAAAAAKIIGITAPAVLQKIKNGFLPAVQSSNRRWRLDRQTVELYAKGFRKKGGGCGVR